MTGEAMVVWAAEAMTVWIGEAMTDRAVDDTRRHHTRVDDRRLDGRPGVSAVSAHLGATGAD